MSQLGLFTLQTTSVDEGSSATITVFRPATFPSGTYTFRYLNGSYITITDQTIHLVGTTINFFVSAENMPAAGSWTVRVYNVAGNYYSSSGSVQLTVNAAPSPAILCFGAGSLILTAFGQVPVENLVVGESLVKTVSGGYRRVTAVKSMTMRNDCGKGGKSRLYVCDSEGYSDAGMIASDGQLILTGAHSVLVSSLTDAEREGVIAYLGEVFVTEGLYRLPVFLDVRAKPYEVEGEFTVYHFALEDKWEHANHGVYANGLLVESASNWHLRDGDRDGDGDMN